jgi:acyl-CoA thioesterase-1
MTTANTHIKQQSMETIVLVQEEGHKLRYSGILPGVYVRSHACSTDDGNRVYMENEDYVVDYKAGVISRTKQSRIPDWRDHPVYGMKEFDHRDYPDYSNRGYMIYIDYHYESEQRIDGMLLHAPTNTLERLIRKLEGKQAVRYVVFGDSISTGGDASRDEFAYYSLFAEAVRARYPEAELEVVNKALGGEGSTTALERVEQDVIALKPDLVSIGYGMNDQCTMGPDIRNGIPPGLFEENIREMVQQIEQKTDAEIILITPCISNPLWKHSSGDLAIYADILLRLSRELGTCVADVHALWVQELQAGKSHESLLLNNVNHPSDYGHAIYFKAFGNLIP